MAMDGFPLSFVTREMSALLTGGRVDKVSQPEKDTLLLLVRSQGDNHRLLLCANANHARMQTTKETYENPADAPMFCMLARKHLVGARILSIRQLGGDRVVLLTLEGIGELGDRVEKRIYLEIMGRYSNLTLTDENDTILDAIRHVNPEMSRVRTVLPGGHYELPPHQHKLDPETLTANQLAERMQTLPCPLDKGLVESVAGMASQVARETCAQVGLDRATPCDQLDWAVSGPLLSVFYASLPARVQPVTLYDEAGLALDYFAFPYRTFDPARQRACDTLSEAMDNYYLGRDVHLRMQQRSQSLQRVIKNAIERCEKKKALYLEALQSKEKTEQYRIFGELLTANLHAIDKGQPSVELLNYYDEQQRTVTIPLSPQLSPAKNAQQYYKKYRKAIQAEQYALEQMSRVEDELRLLEGALDDLDKSATATDLSEIRYLLTQSGYLKPDPAQRKQKKVPEGKPYRFVTGDGTVIEVGKNSLQNDRLTLHARPGETWLHVQGMPGSHVIIRTEDEPSDETLLKAAKLAAYFSKGRNHPAVPIDYTHRKYVKKAAGAAAGFVTYTNFKTILIGLSREDMAQLGQEAGNALESK